MTTRDCSRPVPWPELPGPVCQRALDSCPGVQTASEGTGERDAAGAGVCALLHCPASSFASRPAARSAPPGAAGTGLISQSGASRYIKRAGAGGRTPARWRSWARCGVALRFPPSVSFGQALVSAPSASPLALLPGQRWSGGAGLGPQAGPPRACSEGSAAPRGALLPLFLLRPPRRGRGAADRPGVARHRCRSCRTRSEFREPAEERAVPCAGVGVPQDPQQRCGPVRLLLRKRDLPRLFRCSSPGCAGLVFPGTGGLSARRNHV